jgi:hypothetical protein
MNAGMTKITRQPVMAPCLTRPFNPMVQRVGFISVPQIHLVLEQIFLNRSF